jgi:hypothetical protein
MELKDAFLHARQLHNLHAARLQPLEEASTGGITNSGGMKFNQAGLTMICNVKNDRSSGGSLQSGRTSQKRTCHHCEQAADSRVHPHHFFPQIWLRDGVGA